MGLRQAQAPGERDFRGHLKRIAFFLDLLVGTHKLSMKDLVIKAACGKIAEIPWTEPELLSLRERVSAILSTGGFSIKTDSNDVPQLIQL